MTKDEIIASQAKTIEAQAKQILELLERIAKLELRLNINSTNSSLPPSSDKFKSKKSNSLREKSNNKVGGVIGHDGITLMMQDKVDEVVNINTSFCPNCTSTDLSSTNQEDIKQIIEIVPAQRKVVEHKQNVKICNFCKTKIRLSGKDTIVYGRSAKAFAIYNTVKQFIPINRTQEMFQDLCGFKPSQASIINWIYEYKEILQPYADKAEKRLISDKIKHVDESGCNLGNQWLHVLSNKLYTVYSLAKRGNASWIKKLKGLVVSDCLAVYLRRKNNKILCNQHIMRDCKRIESQEPWAKELSSLLRLISHTKNSYLQNAEEIPKALANNLAKKYKASVNQGLFYHLNLEPLCGKKKRFGYNLALRLMKHKTSFLRCLYDKDVPFTNNQAEQDIRMLKIKLKIGAFRSIKGCSAFAVIRGFISTAKKHGLSILEALNNPSLLVI